VKTIEATLLAHQQQEVTTTCLLVKLECVGAFAGTVYGFTNSDQDRTYDDGDGSVLFRSDNGFTPARLQQTSGVNVDNSEIDGAVSADGITEAMVRAGLFKSAKLTVYRVNYEDLTSGRHEVVGYGRAGETVYWENGWRTEFRSLSQLLKQPINEVYSLRCNAQFGDTRCGVTITWEADGTVTSVGTSDDAPRVFTDSGRSEADDYFSEHGGVIEWLTGNNTGHQMEVDAYTSKTFTLSLDMPYPSEVGDTYRPRRDCDKLWPTCRDVHSTARLHGHNLIPAECEAMGAWSEIKSAVDRSGHRDCC